jgi:hypothetical protein
VPHADLAEAAVGESDYVLLSCDPWNSGFQLWLSEYDPVYGGLRSRLVLRVQGESNGGFYLAPDMLDVGRPVNIVRGSNGTTDAHRLTQISVFSISAGFTGPARNVCFSKDT